MRESCQDILFTGIPTASDGRTASGQLPDRLLWTFPNVVLLKVENTRLPRIIIIEFMSFNHHYPCSEVWAQGDLRRASCEAGRAACASDVFRLLELLPESLEWWKEGKV